MQDYNKLAKKQIALGKPLAVIKKSIEKCLLAEDKAEWTKAKQVEYDEIYKTETIHHDVVLDEEDNVVSGAYIELAYQEDCPTFNDWINETIVTKEEVPATYDDEGNVTVEAVVEVTEMVRPYVAPDNFDTEIDAYLGNTDIYKQTARTKIRAIKDSEDDLTDTKIILQWLSYAIVDIYSVLTAEQKEAMAYGDNIALFAGMIQNPDAKLRVDVEKNQLEKIQKIFADELMFANIAKTEYLDKV